MVSWTIELNLVISFSSFVLLTGSAYVLSLYSLKFKLIISNNQVFCFVVYRDKHFRYSVGWMVPNGSCSSCQPWKLLVFHNTCSFADWCKGSKRHTWCLAPWWMDLQDFDLGFAYHSHVLPSESSHISLWLVTLAIRANCMK